MSPAIFKITTALRLADNPKVLGMFDFVGDAVSDTMETILHNTIYTLCYYITKALCFIVRILDSMFRVVAGIDKIKYLGKNSYLIDVFFGHSLIQNVYIGMAIIGMVMAFAFAIIAVIRKAADIEDMQKTTHTIIIKNLIKTIVIIGGLTFFMQIVLTFSNILMERITFLFDNASSFGKDEVITYTDEEYAAMGRILNKIGNYSLNPSYRSRYNIDACYNDIRQDLEFLWDSGKFDVYYDIDYNTWQTVIQSILNASNPKKAVKADVYYENVANTVLNAMNIVKNDTSLKALSRYETGYKNTNQTTPLDITIFLMGSMNAAMNEAYNVDPSVNDALRFPYYIEKKSIYDFDQVDRDFNISISKMDYVIIWISCFVCLFNLAQLIFSCIGRIFNMLLLYIAAPPLISTYPLDNGGKLRQWFTAFVIQCFAVFGTVIAMRLLILFLPIVASSDLVLFSNTLANLMAKLVIILGATMTASKANSLITGILADNAGMQAIGSAERESARGEAAVKAVGGVGWGATKLAAGLGWGTTKLAGKGTWWLGKKAVGAIKNAGSDDSGAEKDLNNNASNMDKLDSQSENASFGGAGASVTKKGGGGQGQPPAGNPPEGHRNSGGHGPEGQHQGGQGQGGEGPNPEQQRQDYNNMRNIAQPNQQNNHQPNQQNNHQNADKNQLKNMFGLNDQEADEYRRTGRVPKANGNRPNQQNPNQNPVQNPIQQQKPKGQDNNNRYNLVDEDEDDDN